MTTIRLCSFLLRFVLALTAAVPLAATAAAQQTFATPEAAVEALGDDRMTVTVSDGAAQGFELRLVLRGAHVAAPP